MCVSSWHLNNSTSQISLCTFIIPLKICVISAITNKHFYWFFFFSCFMMFKRKLCILKPQKFAGHMALRAYLLSFPLLLLLQIISCTNSKTTIVWLACVMSTFVTRVNHSLPLSMRRCRQIGSFVFRSSYECFLRDWLIRNSRWDSSKVNKSVCLVDFAGFQSTVFSSYNPVQHLRVIKKVTYFL